MKKKKGEEIEIGKRKPSPTPLLTQPGLHPSFPRAAREQPHPFPFGPARSHSFPFFRSVQHTPRRSPATTRPPCSPRQRALTPGPARHKRLHALLPRSARSRLSPAPHAPAPLARRPAQLIVCRSAAHARPATNTPAPPGRPVFLALTPAGAPVHAAQPRSPLCPVDHPSSTGPPTSYTRALSF